MQKSDREPTAEQVAIADEAHAWANSIRSKTKIPFVLIMADVKDGKLVGVIPAGNEHIENILLMLSLAHAGLSGAAPIYEFEPEETH